MQSPIYEQLIPEAALLDLYTLEAHRLHIHGSIAVTYDIERSITLVTYNLTNNHLSIAYNGETPKLTSLKPRNATFLPIHPKIVDDIINSRLPPIPFTVCHSLPSSYYTSFPTYASKDHLCLKTASTEDLARHTRESILRGWTGVYLVLLFPSQVATVSIDTIISLVTTTLGRDIKATYLFTPQQDRH